MVKKPKNKPRKNKGGRPPIYNKQIISKAKEYLKSCKDEEVQKVKQENEEKGYVMYENVFNVKIPTKGGLAVALNIARDTLYDWASKYKEFSDIMERLGAEQEERLINNGLSGRYNSTLSKVLLSKHGYREGLEHSGEDGAPIKVDINTMLNKAYGESSEMHTDS